MSLIRWKTNVSFGGDIEDLFINDDYAHVWVCKVGDRKHKVTKHIGNPFGDVKTEYFRSRQAAKDAMNAKVIVLRMEDKL